MKAANTKQFTRWHEALLLFLKKVITSSNVWLLRKTKGRLGNSFLGVPVLVLTTVGRKSGLPRSQPLYFMENGRQIILVASNAGTGSDPAWLLNIRANPGASANIRGQKREMTAHIANPQEKAQLWPVLTKLFPKWQMMEDRSKRSFPVVVLDPSE
ncbi:nitroreductase family deazaflavin-dependent oxidoreductase [Chloroflexota bacterium]